LPTPFSRFFQGEQTFNLRVLGAGDDNAVFFQGI
jgi:hypothetical protein